MTCDVAAARLKPLWVKVVIASPRPPALAIISELIGKRLVWRSRSPKPVPTLYNLLKCNKLLQI